ncbi:MAG TPA: putative Fe-S cluster assembly protein SufT [Gammaproteobacteria bacterium]|nr:putative Fe-S cluster assembly protein SufT [Gammaproteobacteria bacterium]
MYNREPVVLKRACSAAMIPSGTPVIIPEGTEVNVAQSLGGSFTVYVDGNLLRIAGKDADALGLEPPDQPELPENHTDDDVEKLVWEQMKTCYDPEIPINIVDLGLVYECTLSDMDDGKKRVDVKMTLTAPGCGMGTILSADVQQKIESVPLVKEAHVEIVFDPPWSRDMMSEEAKLQTGMYY